MFDDIRWNSYHFTPPFRMDGKLTLAAASIRQKKRAPFTTNSSTTSSTSPLGPEHSQRNEPSVLRCGQLQPLDAQRIRGSAIWEWWR